MSDPEKNLYEPPRSELASEAPRPKSWIWVGLALFLLVGFYGNLFIPAFKGMAPRPDMLSASLLLHIFLFASLWSRREKNPWTGGALGVVAGAAALGLAAFISRLQ